MSKPPCEETVIASATAAQTTPGRGPWVLTAAILGSSLVFIDGTVVNVALPVVQQQLGASLASIQWIVEAYMLSLAALLLTGGSLGDLYGRRLVFTAGALIFCAASGWCGLAADMRQLVAARALQGVGGALLVPGSLALISVAYPRDRRGRAIGTWAAFTSLTAALGPVLGGWLVEHASWRWVFFINLPVGAIVVAIALWRVPESRGGGDTGATLDWIGAGLAAAGLGALAYGLIEQSWPIGALGLAGMVAFVAVEARTPAPMLPLDLFRSRTFTGANLLTLCLYTALSGVLFFFPMNLIQVQHYSATAAGAALLPFIALMFVLSRWSGGILRRRQARPVLIVGSLVSAAGVALFAVPGIGGPYATTFLPAVVVLGFGMAISVAPLTTTVMGAVEERRAGIASGVNNAVSRVAGFLAIAAFGVVFTAVFNRSLDRRLSQAQLDPGVRASIERQRSAFAAARVDDAGAERILALAFVDAFRGVVGAAALLAALGAASAVWLIDNPPRCGADRQIPAA